MTVSVEVIGAGAAADRFGRMRANLHELERTAPQEAAIAALPAFREAAPKLSGKLAREIHVDGGQVVSNVRSSKGYSYTGVTRFGHRRTGDDRIHASLGRALGPMRIGGRMIWRASVRRYHPVSDWGDAGLRRAQPVVRSRFGELVRDALR
jgi:hypothetical protein